MKLLSSTLEQSLKAVIQEISDFPKAGVNFKDIAPLLANTELCSAIVDVSITHIKKLDIDIICGIESRGFLFGFLLANKLRLPFVPIRKSGKLPGDVVQANYSSEYHIATLEIQKLAIPAASRVLIHDDVLATGGTALASESLLKQCQAQVVGFHFLINLSFLSENNPALKKWHDNITTLINY